MKISWRRGGLLLVPAAFLFVGCVSTTDIDRLHQHITDLEKKVDAVAKQSSSKEEVARLNESLNKQVSTLLRSNADMGARFDELIHEMQALAGKLEDANRRLAQLSQQIAGNAAPSQAGSTGDAGGLPVGSSAPPAVVTVPGRPSPFELFSQATADYQRRQWDMARQGFQEYVDTYPKTDQSDDALYYVGESYLAQSKWKDSITAFDKLFVQYPQSNLAAAAHLKKGLAHLQLGEKAQSIVQLQFVVHEYPTSDEAKSARQKLKELGSDAR